MSESRHPAARTRWRELLKVRNVWKQDREGGQWRLENYGTLHPGSPGYSNLPKWTLLIESSPWFQKFARFMVPFYKRCHSNNPLNGERSLRSWWKTCGKSIPSLMVKKKPSCWSFKMIFPALAEGWGNGKTDLHDERIDILWWWFARALQQPGWRLKWLKSKNCLQMISAKAF